LVPRELEIQVAAIVQRRMPEGRYRLFLFGSRATGRAGERSDFDVGIDAGAAVPAVVMDGIREELEDLPTLYTVDLVDFATVSEEFRRVAGENIRVLDER
jgi:predicted nucleotidyltransferase